MKPNSLLAFTASIICVTSGLPAVEFGNYDIIQLNTTNNGLDAPDPAVSITVAPGSSPNFSFNGANRGDIDTNFGTPDDVANGAIITAVRENGRDNSAGGDPVKTEYVTPLADLGGGVNLGRFFIPLETAPGSEEWNINTAAAYFPFNEGWLAGHTRNSTGANGGVQNVLTATSGIAIGTHFFDNGGGNFTLDLGSLTSHGVPATSQNGVLLVTGQKNEDNYALSSDNPDGSFSIALKDNEADGAATERDPISFAYVPVAAAGPNIVAAVGRVQSDGTAEISGGTFAVTKINDAPAPIVAIGDTTETLVEVTVVDATGISAGQIATGDGIPADTTVIAVSGNTVTLSAAATSTATGVSITFTTPSTSGRWLLEIPGQSATTGTLIVTPCTGGANNLDNIVSYQWDPARGAAGGWVVESRDLPNPANLEDGAAPDEDMFNFVFFTTSPSNPQPTISITSPVNGQEVTVGNSVTITAAAADTAPGTVAAVEFYLDGVLVSTDTTAPYEHTTPVYNSPTSVQVDAVVQDDTGARTSAAQVFFTVTPAAGIGGLYFNGLDEYANLGNPAALGLSTFTLETWFRRLGDGVATTTGTGGVNAIPLISKGRDEADQSNLDMNYFLGIDAATGVLVADFEDSNLGVNVPVRGKTVLPLDEWQHAAATFDGIQWKLYLNGNLEATVNANGLVPRADSIQPAALASALNSAGTPLGYFNGFLDEVRIWSVARTQTELRASCNFEIPAATGLVARWDMSEGTGTTVTSTAAGNLVGNLLNTPFWATGQSFNNNIKPDVAISSPLAGTRFLSGSPILIEAAASDPDGSVSQVDFYDNGLLIGTVNSAPFQFNYTNAPLGGYHDLTAVVTDNAGQTSMSEAVTVDVTLPAPGIPGYSMGVADGGDTDASTLGGPLPADPANWVVETTTASPYLFDNPGTDTGDLAVSINSAAVPFSSGLLLAANQTEQGDLAAADNTLAPYSNGSTAYTLSSIDSENPGASNPIGTEESSRLSLGFFPYADGWIGANVDATGAVIASSANLPASVTITNPSTGVYAISGLPTSGNLIAVPVGDGQDNVVAVGRDGANWIVTSRDNSQTLENEAFGFLYIPETARQVFSGRILSNGTLEPLNDELSFVGGNSNLGTQGYELTIGDGSIINPSNSVMFIVADSNAGNAADNIMSYSGVGNVFVTFSQDLPGLNGQFQSGGFRFLVVPKDSAALLGDEVVVLPTDPAGTENTTDDIEFTFTRFGSTAAPLTVDYSISGSATNGSDHSGLTGSVNFGIGQAEVTVAVDALADPTIELTETVIVTIQAGTGYTPGLFSVATATIADSAPVVPKTTVSFQEGVNGYTGQFDKRVGLTVDQLGSAVSNYFLDGRPANSSPDINGLVRFDNLFGNGPGQIPPGAEVVDARLYITTSTVSNAQSGGPWIVDRLTLPVDANTTYNDLGGDPDTATYDGFEGARGASTGIPVAGFGSMSSGEVGQADVTELVQAWADGNPNYGFAIFTGGTTDGWSYNTVGNPNPVLRPRLEVTYTTLAVKEYFYAADQSAVVNSQSATQDGSTLETLFFDLNDGTTGTTEGILRFPVGFGTGSQQIPIGEDIVKAELLIVTNSPIFLGSTSAQTGGIYAVHQMITDWTVDPLGPPTSFGNLGPVVGTHIEAAAARFEGMGWSATSYVDITSIVRNWRAGAANYGVNVKPETEDGWQPFLPGVINNPQLAGAMPMLRVQTAIITPSLFDDWAAANGIPGSNFNEDQDKDGIIALVEYALGFNPLAFSALPALAPDGSLTFMKGAQAAADPAVIYQLEVSENLVNWQPLTPATNNATMISGQLPANQGKRFGRLAVTYAPVAP